MKYIVSESLSNANFKEFEVIKSLGELDATTDITTIVYHSSTDTDYSVGVHIARLSREENIHFLYINIDPTPIIKLVIAGTEGAIVINETYFDNEADLIKLVESAENTDEELITLGKSVIDVFRKSATLIKGMNERCEELEQRVKELEEK